MRTYLYRLLLGTAAALWVGMGATNLQADVVWSNSSDNGWFTPLNPGNTQLIYGDSGWFGGGNDAPVRLSKIELGLAVSSLGSSAAGTTDMIFRLYDGAPEGIVFGSGDLLFEQRLESVALPAVSFEQPPIFSSMSTWAAFRLGGASTISAGRSSFKITTTPAISVSKPARPLARPPDFSRTMRFFSMARVGNCSRSVLIPTPASPIFALRSPPFPSRVRQ